MFNLSLSSHSLGKYFHNNWFRSTAVRLEKIMRRQVAKQIKTDPIKHERGEVYLVGAGCGDAELLTLKAHRLLQETDVVLYDYLVSPDIVTMIPAHVEKVFVGKKCGSHSMTQAQICQLMSHFALAGKNLVRLKGGDPSIFGRAAEEVAHLTKHSINFAIVPGVTAASGCAAWSGLPLTHRDCAHSVRFVTAHFKNENIEYEWQNYADSNDTLVFYMGMNKITDIAENLIEFGKAASTPIAIIDQGTTAQHRILISDLTQICEDLKSTDLVGPALIMVGEVINQRSEVKSEMLHPHYKVAQRCL
ncbi:uroporphyrinogen-III C-methyltransferase [Psychrobium sp. nBUS_13]|uniref:uroporphyrinogen-III C-methyltransferase n=1 Tax=Psychrobium sp. nBUS_13 TaxID=3395319 RepID=UPI003EB7FEDC